MLLCAALPRLVFVLESWGGAGGWALVLTAFSLGTVVGVVVATRLRPARPLYVAMIAQVMVAIPLFALARPWPIAVVAALAFVSGVSVDVFEVLWQTALQQNIPSESLSRVSAYDWLGSLALTPLDPLARGLRAGRAPDVGSDVAAAG